MTETLQKQQRNSISKRSKKLLNKRILLSLKEIF